MSSVEFVEIENIIVVQVDEFFFFFVAFELKILTCLAQLKTQVHQNTKLLQALHKRADAVDLPEERDEFDISIFPLKKKAELEELEEHLKISELFIQLVSIKIYN